MVIANEAIPSIDWNQLLSETHPRILVLGAKRESCCCDGGVAWLPWSSCETGRGSKRAAAFAALVSVGGGDCDG